MFSAQRNKWTRDIWLTRWSAHRRHDALLLLFLLLFGSALIVLVTSSPSGRAGKVSGFSFPAASSSVSTVNATRVVLTPRTRFARSTPVQSYSFGQTTPGLMQPDVDAHGHLWVGEMSANRLARLDVSTGQVTTWEPPGGKSGIMTTAIDAQGMVWFVEQNANYLGRFDPATQRFQTFPLQPINQHQMGPQSLQFDATDQLWFTAETSGDIGRLNPTTGKIQTWPVPAPVSGAPAAPFSLTVTRTGQIWFGYLTGGTVGLLDPATGHVTLFRLGDPQATIFSMAADRTGRIWFTELLPGRLGMIDPATKRITLLSVPSIQHVPPVLYGVVAAPDGSIWFADNTASALVRYRPEQATSTFFALPTTSAPYGLTLGPDGTIWSTSSNCASKLLLP
jgi:virginiamycin B lyase